MTTAQTPEDITRLFVERVNAGDVEGLVALYEPTAVMAYPPGTVTEGEDAIRALFQQMLAAKPQFPQEEPLPIALRRRRADVHPRAGRHRRPGTGRAPPGRRQLEADHRPAGVGCVV
jgi:hypothetical protein